MVATFRELHGVLQERYPRDWLLRWNLLESLLKLDIGKPLAHQLRNELEELEVRLQHLQPIATGLRYLAERA